MAVSGSVHLGLIAILAWPSSAVIRTLNTVEVSFLEPKAQVAAVQPHTPAPRHTVIPVQKPQPKAESAPQESESASEEAESETQPAASAVSGSTGTPAPVQNAYAALVAREINRRKVYPPVALRLRQQGRVKVQFRVERSGTVVEAELLEESPHEQLNRAAKRLIEDIHQFQPFPDDVKESSWVFTVPIEYTM